MAATESASVAKDFAAAKFTRTVRCCQAFGRGTHRTSQPPSELQPFALYWIGQAELTSADETERNAAWLTLLRIPAVHGERAPDLAATVLERLQASNQEDRALQLRIQRELIEKYPASAAAKKLLPPAPQGDAPRLNQE